jgi:chemotaxis signal transduction protein
METIEIVQPLLSPVEALGEEFVLTEDVSKGKAPAAVAERLGFRIGPVGLLCTSDTGREVVLPPPVTRLPHLPPWIRGLTNVLGTLLPVADLAAAFGVEHDEARTEFLLIVGAGETALGLLVDGLPVITRFEPGEAMRGIPPHPARLAGHILGGFERDGVVWLDVGSEAIFAALADGAEV